jgi:galactose mutarotase-like enzyme
MSEQVLKLQDATGQSQLTVYPERGGIITSWQVQGQEMFYLDTERFTDPSLSVRGGNPILFPICGNLPADSYTHAGQTYRLKQHGFARSLPWRILAQTSDQVTLGLSSQPATLEHYPFEFRLEFTYRLLADTLEIISVVVNTGSQTLPFSLGFHPYFLANNKSQLKFQLPAQQMQPNGATAPLAFTGEFDWQQPEIDVALRPLTDIRAAVQQPERTLMFSYDSVFTTLVFWTLQDKPFYCLEPWSAPRNALNTGEDLLHVPAGERWQARFALQVVKPASFG